MTEMGRLYRKTRQFLPWRPDVAISLAARHYAMIT